MRIFDSTLFQWNARDLSCDSVQGDKSGMLGQFSRVKIMIYFLLFCSICIPAHRDGSIVAMVLRNWPFRAQKTLQDLFSVSLLHDD